MAGICQQAETFTKNYYKLLDNCRSEISRLYHNQAVLVYDGNSISMQSEIQSFLDNIPKSQHTINTLNAQPVGTQEMIIQISGVVELTETNPKVENLFSQTLFLRYVKQVAKWKIVSDTIRTVEKHPVTENAEKKQVIVAQEVPIEKIEIEIPDENCFKIIDITSGFSTFSSKYSQESSKSQDSDTKFEEALHASEETTQKMEDPGTEVETLQSMIEIYPNQMDIIKTEDYNNMDEY